MTTIAEKHNAAVGYHRAGQLQHAEQLYREILQIDPQQPDALHLLGTVAAQCGKHDTAADLIGRAVKLNPRNETFHNNLGSVWQVQGELEAAVGCYRRAVQLNPGNADFHINLGGALQAQDKLDEAIGCFQQAIQVNPENAESHVNLANAFKEQGRLDEARSQFDRAREIAPNKPLSELRTSTLLPTVFRDRLEIEESRRQFLADIGRIADHHTLLTPAEICAYGVEPPFSLQFFYDNIRPLKEAYARIFANSFSDVASSARKRSARIGFVVTSHHGRDISRRPVSPRNPRRPRCRLFARNHGLDRSGHRT